MRFLRHLPVIASLLIDTGCAPTPPADITHKPDIQRIVLPVTSLPGWTNYNAALHLYKPLQQHCAFLDTTKKHPTPAWPRVCTQLAKLNKNDLKAFIAQNFKAVELQHASHQGLFTGYHQPHLFGSRTQTKRFKYPLYQRPNDLITINLKNFDPSLSGTLKGKVSGSSLKPYTQRAQFNPQTAQPLVWLEKPSDAFFMEIQGSGAVTLPNGEIMYVGYAIDNGHTYHAIGKTLLQNGALPKNNVNADSIKAWLNSKPLSEQQRIFNTNPRQIFFAERNTLPPGAFGIPLTPMVSMAVDKRYIPLGSLLYIDTTITETEATWQHAMLAHDVGGAIKGAIRGDIYFGADDKAASFAAHQNSPGRLFVLEPQ